MQSESAMLLQDGDPSPVPPVLLTLGQTVLLFVPHSRTQESDESQQSSEVQIANKECNKEHKITQVTLEGLG